MANKKEETPEPLRPTEAARPKQKQADPIDDYPPQIETVAGDKPEGNLKSLTADQKDFVLMVQKNDYVLNSDFIRNYNDITGEKETFMGYNTAQINRMKRILRETVDKNYKQD